MEPEAALAICRFLHDGTAMILWGASAFLWTLVPAPLAGAIGRRLATGRLVFILVTVATTVAALPLAAAAIGDGWPDACDPATLRGVLLETSVGRAWMAQAAASLLLVATLAAPAQRRLGATALATGVLLSTLVLTGHAAMHEGALGVEHRLNDVTHVLAAGAWLGALVPLMTLLRMLDDASCGRDAAIALRRFSAAGHAVVAIVIMTGIANMVLVLGRWPTDWSSPYQALLAAKVGLVLIMTALALYNRYRLVPKLVGARASIIRDLRRATCVEIALGCGVVGLVSSFGLLDPS